MSPFLKIKFQTILLVTFSVFGIVGAALLVSSRTVVHDQRASVYEAPLEAFPTIAVETPVAEPPLSLLFVGDIMLSRGIGTMMVKNKDWCYPFLNVKDLIGSADLTFANLEGPISSRGTKVGSIYSFRADPHTVDGLLCAGIDVVSIANNHIWDYSRDAFNDTLTILSKNNLTYTGGGVSYVDAHTPRVVDVKGTKVAFLAYTGLLPGFLGKKAAVPAVAFPLEEDIMRDIRNARAIADIVVVSFHWGDEYHTKHNTAQEKLGHFVIDAGADLVIGHHPHVAQEVEKYKQGYIAYSLGNFVFDQNFSADTHHGLVLKVLLHDKKILGVEEHTVIFNNSYQPSFKD